MSSNSISLLHSVPRSQIEVVLRQGLKAMSTFDDLGLEIRQGVVYCWLRKEHDKMWGRSPDYAYVEVSVNEDRCRVADMDFSSIAMMYLQGHEVARQCLPSCRRPRNEEAARLLGDVYRVTSVTLSEYVEGMFSTPEVLVKGNIAAEDITLVPDKQERTAAEPAAAR